MEQNKTTRLADIDITPSRSDVNANPPVKTKLADLSKKEIAADYTKSYGARPSTVGALANLDGHAVIHDKTDPDQIRALRQSSGTKYWNSAKRFAPVLVGNVVKSAGFVAGGLTAIGAEAFTLGGAEGSKIMNDNFIVKAGDDWNNMIKESWAPIYNTNEYYDSTNPFQKIFGEGAAGISDAASFMGSAMIPGLGFSKVFKVGGTLVKMYSKANRLAKLGKVQEASKLLKRAKDLSNTMKPVSKQTGKAVGGDVNLIAKQHQKIINGIDFGSTHIYNMVSEAGFEGQAARQELFENHLWDTDSDGNLVSSAELDEIQYGGWKKAFAYNMALLGVTNLPETKALFNTFNKVKLSKAKARQMAKIPNTKRAKIAHFAEGAAISAAAEGIAEEGGQMAIEQIATDVDASGNPLEAIPMMFQKMLDNFGTVEGQEAMMTGALIGLIPGGTSRLADQRRARREGIAAVAQDEFLTSAISSYTDELFKTNEKGEIIITDGKPEYDLVKINNKVEELQKTDSVEAALLQKAVKMDSKILYNHLMNRRFMGLMSSSILSGEDAVGLNEDIDFFVAKQKNVIANMEPGIEKQQLEKETEELVAQYRQTAKEMQGVYNKASGIAYEAYSKGLIEKNEIDVYAEKIYGMELQALSSLNLLRDFSSELATFEDAHGLTASRDYNRAASDYMYTKDQVKIAEKEYKDAVDFEQKAKERLSNEDVKTDSEKLKIAREDYTDAIDNRKEAKIDLAEQKSKLKERTNDVRIAKEEFTDTKDKTYALRVDDGSRMLTMNKELTKEYGERAGFLSDISELAENTINERRKFNKVDDFKKIVDARDKVVNRAKEKKAVDTEKKHVSKFKENVAATKNLAELSKFAKVAKKNGGEYEAAYNKRLAQLERGERVPENEPMSTGEETQPTPTNQNEIKSNPASFDYKAAAFKNATPIFEKAVKKLGYEYDNVLIQSLNNAINRLNEDGTTPTQEDYNLIEAATYYIINNELKRSIPSKINIRNIINALTEALSTEGKAKIQDKIPSITKSINANLKIVKEQTLAQREEAKQNPMTDGSVPNPSPSTPTNQPQNRNAKPVPAGSVVGYVPVLNDKFGKRRNKEKLNPSESTIVKKLQSLEVGSKVTIQQGTYENEPTLDIISDGIKVGSMQTVEYVQGEIDLYEKTKNRFNNEKTLNENLIKLRDAYMEAKDSPTYVSGQVDLSDFTAVFDMSNDALNTLAYRSSFVINKALTPTPIDQFNNWIDKLNGELEVVSPMWERVTNGESFDFEIKVLATGGFENGTRKNLTEVFDNPREQDYVYYKDEMLYHANTNSRHNAGELVVDDIFDKADDGIIYIYTDKTLNGSTIPVPTRTNKLTNKDAKRLASLLKENHKEAQETGRKAGNDRQVDILNELNSILFTENTVIDGIDRNVNASYVSDIGDKGFAAYIKLDGATLKFESKGDTISIAKKNDDSKNYNAIATSNNSKFDSLLHKELLQASYNIDNKQMLEDPKYLGDMIEQGRLAIDSKIIQDSDGNIISFTVGQGDGTSNFLFEVGPTVAIPGITAATDTSIQTLTEQRFNTANVEWTLSDGVYNIEGNQYERQSHAVARLLGKAIPEDNDNMRMGAAVGNFIDVLSRDIFTDTPYSYDEVKKESEAIDPNNAFTVDMTKEVFDSLVDEVNTLKADLVGQGYTFIKHEVLVNREYTAEQKEASGKFGMAGVVDLVAIDVNGTAHIIDFKNIKYTEANAAKLKENTYVEGYNGQDSKVVKWSDQQGTYSVIGSDITNFGSLSIFPVLTRYDNEGNAITLSGVNNLNNVETPPASSISPLSESLINLPFTSIVKTIEDATIPNGTTEKQNPNEVASLAPPLGKPNASDQVALELNSQEAIDEVKELRKTNPDLPLGYITQRVTEKDAIYSKYPLYKVEMSVEQQKAVMDKVEGKQLRKTSTASSVAGMLDFKFDSETIDKSIAHWAERYNMTPENQAIMKDLAKDVDRFNKLNILVTRPGKNTPEIIADRTEYAQLSKKISEGVAKVVSETFGVEFKATISPLFADSETATFDMRPIGSIDDAALNAVIPTVENKGATELPPKAVQEKAPVVTTKAEPKPTETATIKDKVYTVRDFDGRTPNQLASLSIASGKPYEVTVTKVVNENEEYFEIEGYAKYDGTPIPQVQKQIYIKKGDGVELVTVKPSTTTPVQDSDVPTDPKPIREKRSRRIDRTADKNHDKVSKSTTDKTVIGKISITAKSTTDNIAYSYRNGRNLNDFGELQKVLSVKGLTDAQLEKIDSLLAAIANTSNTSLIDIIRSPKLKELLELQDKIDTMSLNDVEIKDDIYDVALAMLINSFLSDGRYKNPKSNEYVATIIASAKKKPTTSEGATELLDLAEEALDIIHDLELQYDSRKQLKKYFKIPLKLSPLVEKAEQVNGESDSFLSVESINRNATTLFEYLKDKIKEFILKLKYLMDGNFKDVFAKADAEVNVMIKPLGMAYGTSQTVREFIIKNGGSIKESKTLTASKNQIATMYSEYKNEPFFGDLVEYYSGQEVTVMNVAINSSKIDKLNELLGSTKNFNQETSSLRHQMIGNAWKQLADNGQVLDNGVHISKSKAHGQRENNIWFNDKVENFDDTFYNIGVAPKSTLDTTSTESDLLANLSYLVNVYSAPKFENSSGVEGKAYENGRPVNTVILDNLNTTDVNSVVDMLSTMGQVVPDTTQLDNGVIRFKISSPTGEVIKLDIRTKENIYKTFDKNNASKVLGFDYKTIDTKYGHNTGGYGQMLELMASNFKHNDLALKVIQQERDAYYQRGITPNTKILGAIGGFETINRDNVKTVKTWLKDKLPQAKLNTVSGLIRAMDGSLNYGLSKGASIVLSTEATFGTGYHEALHFVINELASPEVAETAIDQIKMIYGVSDTEQANEILADAFRTYVITNEVAEELPQDIQELLPFMHEVTSLLADNDVINTLFEDIIEGRYSSTKVPLRKARTDYNSINKTQSLATQQGLTFVEKQSAVKTLTGMFLDVLNMETKDGRKYMNLSNRDRMLPHDDYGNAITHFVSAQSPVTTSKLLIKPNSKKGIYTPSSQSIIYGADIVEKMIAEFEKKLTNMDVTLDGMETQMKENTPEYIELRAAYTRLDLLLNPLYDYQQGEFDSNIMVEIIDEIQKTYSFKYMPLHDLLQKRDEVLEQTGLSMDAISTTALFNDKMIEDDYESTFRPISKQAIASLKKEREVYREDGTSYTVPVYNKEYVFQEYVDYDVMIPKIIFTLTGMTSKEAMLSKMLQDSTYIPELKQLYDKAMANENLQESLFVDLNKIIIKERHISNKGEIKIKRSDKEGSYLYSNAWAETIKNELADQAEYKTNVAAFNKVRRAFVKNTGTIPVSKTLNDLSKAFNGLGISLTADEIYYYATDISNAKANLITEKPIVGFESMNLNEKLASTLNILISKMASANVDIARRYKRINADTPINTAFSNFKDLNSIAKIKDKYGYGAEALKLVFLDVNGNMKSAINKISQMGKFTNLLKNGTDAEILAKLKTYLLDKSLKHSNLLVSLKDKDGKIIRNGFLIEKDGDYVLNNDFVAKFDYFTDGGAYNPYTSKTAAYKNSETINWQTAKMVYYTENGNDKATQNRVSMTGLLPGDASNNYFYEIEKLSVIKGVDYKGTKIIKDSPLYLTLLNTYKQERARMDEALNLIFGEPVDGGPAMHTVVNELGDTITDNEYYDNAGFVQDYHYTVDRKGNKIFLDKEGRPAGNVFKFQNFTTLNELTDSVSTQIDAKDEVIVQKMFDELVADAHLVSPDYQHILDTTPEIGNVLNQSEQGLIFEFSINQRLFNIEYQNMFSGVTAQFGSALQTDGSYNVSEKGVKQTAVRNKAVHQAGTAGVNNANPNVEIMVIRDLYLDSKTLVSQRAEIKRQLKRDGYKPGTEAYAKVFNLIESGLTGNNVGDGQGWMSLHRWATIQKTQGRWSEYEYLFEPVTTDENGREVYKLRKGIPLHELTNILEVQKPMYSRRTPVTISDKNGKPHTVFINEYLKYASFPLIEEFTKFHPDLDKIRQYMDAPRNTEGVPVYVDEVMFESAEKQGATFVNKVFDDSGALIEGALEAANTKTTSFNDYRVQLEISSHGTDSENKLGTQITKSIIGNIDVNATYTIPGVGTITGQEVIDRHFKLLNGMIVKDYRRLLAKLNLEDDGVTIRIKDFKAINDVLLNEVKRTGLGEDVAKLFELNEDGNLKYSLDTNTIRAKILSIFTAQFTNNVKFTKFRGDHLVLVSDAGMKATPMRNLSNESRSIAKKKNGLSTVKQEDGSFIAEILVPPYSRDFYSDGQLLPMDKIDPEVLRLMGYRIPNTGKHSNVTFKVVGFLPKISGSVIVTSSDFVGMTGWDFDVDSVYMMNKNTQRNRSKEGEYAVLPYSSPTTYTGYVNEKFDKERVTFSDTDEYKQLQDIGTKLKAIYKSNSTKALKGLFPIIADRRRFTEEQNIFIDEYYSLEQLETSLVDKEKWLASNPDSKRSLYEYNEVKDAIEAKTVEIESYLPLEYEGTPKEYFEELAPVRTTIGQRNRLMLNTQLINDMHNLPKQYANARRALYRLFKEDGLIVSKEEWEANVEERKSYETLQNDLFDTWDAIQNSPNHMIERYSPSTTAVNNKAKKKVDSTITHTNPVYQSVIVNPTSTTFQDLTHPRAVNDKQNLSIFANYGSLLNVHQVVDSKVISDSPAIFNYTLKDLGIDENKKDYKDSIKYLKDNFNAVIEGDIVTVYLSRVGKNPTGGLTNIEGYSISQMIGEDTDQAADAIKDYLIGGINSYTREAYSYAKAIGNSTDYIAFLINQPLIKNIGLQVSRNESFALNEVHQYVDTRIVKMKLEEKFRADEDTLTEYLDEYLKREDADVDAVTRLQDKITRGKKGYMVKGKREYSDFYFQYATKAEVELLFGAYSDPDFVITPSSMFKQLQVDYTALNDEGRSDYDSIQLSILKHFINMRDNANIIKKYNKLLAVDKKAIGNNFNRSLNDLADIKSIMANSMLSRIKGAPSNELKSNGVNIFIKIFPELAQEVASEINDNYIESLESSYGSEPDVGAPMDVILDSHPELVTPQESAYPLIQDKFNYGDMAAYRVASQFLLSEHLAVKEGMTDRLRNSYPSMQRTKLEKLQAQAVDFFITSVSAVEVRSMAFERIEGKSYNKFVSDTYANIKKYKTNNPNREANLFIDHINLVSKADHLDNRMPVLTYGKGVSAKILDEVKNTTNTIFEGESELKELLLDVLAISYFRSGLGFDTDGLHNIITVPIQDYYNIFDRLKETTTLVNSPGGAAKAMTDKAYSYFEYHSTPDDAIAPRIYPKQLRYAIKKGTSRNGDKILIKGDRFLKGSEFEGNYFKQITSFPVPGNKKYENAPYVYRLFRLNDIVYKDVDGPPQIDHAEYVLISEEKRNILSMHYKTNMTFDISNYTDTAEAKFENSNDVDYTNENKTDENCKQN